MTEQEHEDILIVAATFEAGFSVDWLVELLKFKASKVLSALESAIEKAWIVKEGPSTFRFIDIHKREQLIEKLDHKKKQKLHDNIIDILKRELCEDDSKYFIISKYLLQSDNDIERSRWLVSAADRYVKAYRSSEALFCYSKVLKDLVKLEGQESDCLFAETAIKYSKISTARHNPEQVLVFLEKAITKAYKWNRKDLQTLAEMQKAKNEWLRSNYREAMEHFERGWSLAKELDDPKILRSANIFASFFLYWQGRFEEVVRSYENFVPDVEKYPSGSFSLLAAIMVGRCYAITGRVAEGIGMMNAIQQHCQEQGDSVNAALASYTLGATMVDIRRLDDAQRYLTYALNETSVEPSWTTIRSRVVLAHVYLLLGDREKCVYHIQEHLQYSRVVNVTARPYPYWMELCWAVKQKQLPPIDELDLTNEVNRIINSKNILLKGLAFRYKALLSRDEGANSKTIIDLLNKSVGFLTESGYRIELANTQVELARQFQYIENVDRAKKAAEEAYLTFLPFGHDLFPDDLRVLLRKSVSRENILEEVLRLSQSIITARDNKDVAQRIISASNKITGAERGAIFLVESNNSHRIKLRVSKNLTATDVDGPKFHKSLQLIKRVVHDGEGNIQRSPTTKDIQSCICVPMILRDKVVGVLYHDNRFLRKAFKKEDLKLLGHFATLAAFILDNVQTYDEIKNLNQKLSEKTEYLEQQQLQDTGLHRTIGTGATMKRIASQAHQVANNDTTVLILGETGVGKELVARAIHDESGRKSKPFISVHCSALPESLISSELFGHEKGAFTGAVSRRIGRFELADGGTLFLDEIGELSAGVQVMLLRVLQTKEFERVGGNETIRSNFRLIAATNLDLELKIHENSFRSDLFYRLNVFPIYVPPLRERTEDIPVLVDFFVKLYATKLKKSILKVSDKDMQKLLDYHWPGNVRELENIIERGVILSSGQYLTVPDLNINHSTIDHQNNNVSLKENERRHIIWALQKTNWKVRGQGGAAELLDIHPSTLAFRMQKLGIRKTSEHDH